jgi:hypothetical protein
VVAACNPNRRTLKWVYRTNTLLKCNKQILKPLTKIAHYCVNGGVDGGRVDIGASKG